MLRFLEGFKEMFVDNNKLVMGVSCIMDFMRVAGGNIDEATVNSCMSLADPLVSSGNTLDI
jgi:hypothetical protein